MLEAPVGRLLLKMAVPAATGFFFNTMFNVTDTFYTRFISPDALAGLGLSFPIYLIFISVGSGLGNAVQALSANSLGKGEEKRAALLGISGLILAVTAAAFAAAAGFPLLLRIIALMGASGEPLTQALSYTRVILGGLVFFTVNAVLNGILSSRGDTRSYRNVLIIGFFANLALDPLFILVLGMGTAGIALATVIVQAAGTGYLFLRVRRLRLGSEAGHPRISTSVREWGGILSHAVPVSLNTMTVALGVFVINYFLVRYGSHAAVAGYGAAIRIEQVFLLPVMGLNTAVLTLVGQNNGAGRIDRVRKSWLTGQLYGCAVMGVGFLILFPLRSFWVGLFSPDPAVTAAGSGYLSIEVFSMFSYVFLNMGAAALQGLRKPGFVFLIGLLRQIVLPPLVFYLLGDLFNMGVWGVWWGLFIIPTLAAAATVLYTRSRMKAAAA